MPVIAREIELLPKQIDAWEGIIEREEIRRVFYIGGIQTGKTFSGAEITVEVAKRLPPGSRIWCVAPTLKLGERQVEALLAALPVEMISMKYGGERLSKIRLVNKTVIEFRTAVQPERLKGHIVNFIWWDEAGQCSKVIYDIIQGRLLKQNGKLLVTTTPKRTMSIWMNREFERKKDDPAYRWIFSRTEENTTLDPIVVAELRSQYVDEYALEELDGAFIGASDGLVYKNFSDRHLISEYVPQETDLIYTGIDYGLNDPFVCLYMAYTKRGQWIVFDEIYRRRLAPSDQVAAMKLMAWEPRVDDTGGIRWSDPSALGTRAEMQKAGLISRPARQHKIRDGIPVVYAWFSKTLADGSPGLLICRNCTQTIRELGVYHYPDKTGVNIGEDPVDDHNHAMDAMRYVLFSQGKPPGITATSNPEEKLRQSMGQKGTSVIYTPEGKSLLTGVTPPFYRNGGNSQRLRRSWRG